MKKIMSLNGINTDLKASKQTRLTEMAKASGWAAKISPEILSQVLRNINKSSDENLLVGLEHSDDAAVYQLNEQTAIIQTLDFFTPIVDDPYDFGQIAAANALSDIYAMGGEPILALNIVCFPDSLEPSVLSKILKGGQDKVEEAGAILAGGHSVVDAEPKYGLSVTGLIDPNKIMANNTSKVGDVLILTKPLGVGIINTAIKQKKASQEATDIAIKSMKTLNKYAKDACQNVTVHSITDITGFGLGGHAIEMAEASNVSFVIDSKKIIYIDEARDFAKQGVVPGGAAKNKKFFIDRCDIKDTVEDFMHSIIFDPQTSGGLLISVDKQDAETILDRLKDSEIASAIIGEVVDFNVKNLIVN